MKVAQDLDGARESAVDIVHSGTGALAFEVLDRQSVYTVRSITDGPIRHHEKVIGPDRYAETVGAEAVRNRPFARDAESSRFGIEAQDQLGDLEVFLRHPSTFAVWCHRSQTGPFYSPISSRTSGMTFDP